MLLKIHDFKKKLWDILKYLGHIDNESSVCWHSQAKIIGILWGWKLRNNENKLFKDSIQEANKECRFKSRDTGREEMLKIRIEISELSN